MTIKILVAYASKYGSTAEIAQAIGETLRGLDFEVDVQQADQVSSLLPYGAVVLGSAVYAGMWRKDAVAFLEENQDALASKPVWLFSSGPTGEGDPVELLDGWTLPDAQREIADRISPQDIAVFHGHIDPDKLNFGERLIIKAVKGQAGDFRDWDAIRAWARQIGTVMSSL
jgi:menaquinone-dependent protoporphyrinogen oxidase